LALVIVFFALPYFTDVAYYADQTPTHSAQENSKVEGKTEANHEKIPLAVADVQTDSIVGHALTSQNVYKKRIPHLTSSPPSSQHLFLTLLISRPPPVA
jgi:hypothetical protein